MRSPHHCMDQTPIFIYLFHIKLASYFNYILWLKFSSPSASFHSFAVSGGADLVRNTDTTFAWEASSKTRVESGDGTRGLFQALTGGLAVSCGSGRFVEALDPIAAAWRDCRNRTPEVANATPHAASHLPTCYDRLCNWCSHHHTQQHHA